MSTPSEQHQRWVKEREGEERGMWVTGSWMEEGEVGDRSDGEGREGERLVREGMGINIGSREMKGSMEEG